MNEKDLLENEEFGRWALLLLLLAFSKDENFGLKDKNEVEQLTQKGDLQIDS